MRYKCSGQGIYFIIHILCITLYFIIFLYISWHRQEILLVIKVQWALLQAYISINEMVYNIPLTPKVSTIDYITS